MSSAAFFLSGVPEDRRERFAAVPDLEEALSKLFEAGRAAWPDIDVNSSDFLIFIGRFLPAEAAGDLASIRAGDLYLVCAFSLGVPGAAQAFDDVYMRRVEVALSRLSTPAAMIADIQQELRRRLVEMRSPRPDRKLYAGRGDLTGWLCVSAVREANRRRERGKREQPLDEYHAVLLASPDEDPEMAYIQRTYKRELQAAFKEAIASLSSKERNLLRYHFLDGLSIDRIGLLYGVHRATAARWINQARDALCKRTRELVCQRVSVSQEGFERLLGLLESQIRIHLDAAQA